MKLLALALAAAPFASSISLSQGVFLQAGESYVYRFDGFENRVHYSMSGQPYAHFDLPIYPGSALAPNGALQIEFFNDDISESPFFTRTLTTLSLPSDTQIVINDAWNDVQGAIRFSMLSGSFELERMVLAIGVTAPAGGFDLYGGRIQITSVPEPGTVALAGVAVAFGILAGWGSRRRTA
ncbi:MAG TPA: PEP-CTERM sorting domain-containing protein [Verrucomicrobiota bacterium]|nr:hypothetical protein [Verrucomicrobiales bacterium]HRI13286.1 PEP-CTERM sorting domain-containing protein [Verrucomicrobiota bacterium]